MKIAILLKMIFTPVNSSQRVNGKRGGRKGEGERDREIKLNIYEYNKLFIYRQINFYNKNI